MSIEDQPLPNINVFKFTYRIRIPFPDYDGQHTTQVSPEIVMAHVGFGVTFDHQAHCR